MNPEIQTFMKDTLKRMHIQKNQSQIPEQELQKVSDQENGVSRLFEQFQHLMNVIIEIPLKGFREFAKELLRRTESFTQARLGDQLKAPFQIPPQIEGHYDEELKYVQQRLMQHFEQICQYQINEISKEADAVVNRRKQEQLSQIRQQEEQIVQQNLAPVIQQMREECARQHADLGFPQVQEVLRRQKAEIEAAVSGKTESYRRQITDGAEQSLAQNRIRDQDNQRSFQRVKEEFIRKIAEIETFVNSPLSGKWIDQSFELDGSVTVSIACFTRDRRMPKVQGACFVPTNKDISLNFPAQDRKLIEAVRDADAEFIESPVPGAVVKCGCGPTFQFQTPQSRPRSPNYRGMGVAHWHALLGNSAGLSNREDLVCRDDAGQTPALVSCLRGETRCASVLLEHKVSFADGSRHGLYPLYVAMYDGNRELVLKLLKSESLGSLEWTSEIGESLWHLAVIHKLPDVLQQLPSNCRILTRKEGRTVTSSPSMQTGPSRMAQSAAL
jgi:hypothetical protein